jgi:holo-[acyl-carrier-protein] synthase
VVLGVGLDLVRIDRAARLLEVHGDAILHQIAHRDELGEHHRRDLSPDRFATLLAQKEAVFKALGYGVADPLDWLQVQVRSSPGASLTLSGPVLDAVVDRGVTHILFNWGAAADVRFAVAILWRNRYDR